MKCVYCNSRRAALDLELNKCVCKKCKKEFTDKPKREPEALNGFSLIVVSILLQIPIISSFIVLFVCTGEVEYPYRKCIAYQYVAHLFIMLSMIYLLGLDIDLQQNYIISMLVDRASIVHNSIVDIDIEREFTEQYYEKIIIQDKQEEDVVDVQEVFITPEEVVYLNGVILDYDKTKELIEIFTNSNYGMLLQTNAIKDKYDKSTYYNIGCVFEQSDIKESTTPILFEYVNEGSVRLYYNGDKEVVKLNNKDVYKSKYVYSLKSNELYKVKLLYNDENVFVGASLTALEE